MVIPEDYDVVVLGSGAPGKLLAWALASLGVDLDELRARLRTARLAGTTDEQPEQAGRRQMAINVSDEMLTIVLTDPVIVEAGKEALRTLHARKAAAEKAAAERGAAAGAAAAAGDLAAGAETSAAETSTTEASTTEGSASEAGHVDSGAASATSTVIRGDHPAAAGLANVWLELRKTLTFIADAPPPDDPDKRSRPPRPTETSKLAGRQQRAWPGGSAPAAGRR